MSHIHRLKGSKIKKDPGLLGPAVFIVISVVFCSGNHILWVMVTKTSLIKSAKGVEMIWEYSFCKREDRIQELSSNTRRATSQVATCNRCVFCSGRENQPAGLLWLCVSLIFKTNRGPKIWLPNEVLRLVLGKFQVKMAGTGSQINMQ